ncbi:beta-lactoglobulin [Pteropus medius]|uniref:beta-lactoglobulin n=1 Tax=Pteropus vampyrus TaxID=132908 RepID=UPI00196ADFAC|nr:beta-lactoglobulin [Pteropus giganteus]
MPPGRAGRPGRAAGAARAAVRASGRGTCVRKGRRPPGLPSRWAPGTGPLLLLTLSLGLAGAQQAPDEVPVQPGFDARKVEGRWLTVQLAASRADLVSPEDPLRLALHSIRTRDTDLELVLFWTGEGVCRGVNVTIHPTGLRGQYRGSFEGGGSMLVRFVSTDYSSLILYVRVEDSGEVTDLWALLARSGPEDSKWRREFLRRIRGFRLQEVPVFNLDGKR